MMPWVPFSYSDYDTGVYWVLTARPEVDADTSSNGATVGGYTGQVERSAVLTYVQEDHNGDPVFLPVDSAIFGEVGEGDGVTHFCEVTAPTLPSL